MTPEKIKKVFENYPSYKVLYEVDGGLYSDEDNATRVMRSLNAKKGKDEKRLSLITHLRDTFFPKQKAEEKKPVKSLEKVEEKAESKNTEAEKSDSGEESRKRTRKKV